MYILQYTVIDTLGNPRVKHSSSFKTLSHKIAGPEGTECVSALFNTKCMASFFTRSDEFFAKMITFFVDSAQSGTALSRYSSVYCSNRLYLNKANHFEVRKKCLLLIFEYFEYFPEFFASLWLGSPEGMNAAKIGVSSKIKKIMKNLLKYTVSWDFRKPVFVFIFKFYLNSFFKNEFATNFVFSLTDRCLRQCSGKFFCLCEPQYFSVWPIPVVIIVCRCKQIFWMIK